MQTREKLGAQVKKLLSLCYDMKDQVISATKLISLCKEILTDVKKLLELIFILEGLGFITRISKKNFIYSGYKGMSIRIMEMVQSAITKSPSDREHWLFSEEFTYENKRYLLRQPVYMGLFYQEILSLIFSTPSKMVNRDTIEKALEQLAPYLQIKDFKSGLIFNEMTSIMTSLNLLDKRNQPDSKQEFEIYQWIGPEIYTFLLEEFNPFSLTLKHDILERAVLSPEKETTFMSSLFREFAEEPRQVMYQTKFPLSHFPECAYALLKGKNITFYIKKLAIIIGRLCTSRKYAWEVDLALDQSSRISKQHAVIVYNPQIESFEIQCLSRKKPVIIDGTSITNKDKPYQLKHRSFVQISKASFTFYLPNQNQEEIQQMDDKVEVE